MKSINDYKRKITNLNEENRILRQQVSYLKTSQEKVNANASNLRLTARRDRQMVNEARLSRNNWRNKYKKLRDSIKELL